MTPDAGGPHVAHGLSWIGCCGQRTPLLPGTSMKSTLASSGLPEANGRPRSGTGAKSC